MFLDKTDLCVMEELCENSRTLLKNIAGKSGVSIQTVSSRMRRLESALGLRYALELDLEALGLRSEHVVRVKLKPEAQPDDAALAELLSSPFVQLACKTKGDFDMFFWVVTPSMQFFSSEVEPKLREALGDVVEDWAAYPLVSHLAGFLPVGPELADQFREQKPRAKTIRLMVGNARISVTDLAEQLGVTEPTAEYHLKKARPFVRRFTAFFTGRGEFTHVIRFLQLRGKKQDLESEGRRITEVYLNSDPRLFNRLAFAAKPSGGMDALLIETNSSLEDSSSATEELLSGTKIVGKHVSAVVSSVQKGAIPIRKVGLAKTCQSVVFPQRPAAE
ncbi:MAG: winged helix-turn-helix transcriptional regulator [Candidatus ainarchaeum sp.]|nr:winged helix-turn-helix transcriptional regulator [Candidatus ainarchaeum sp.]